jgi:hypothetical protein
MSSMREAWRSRRTSFATCSSSLPGEYLRDKKQMVFLCSVDADLDYRNTLAERATGGGDRFLEEDTPVLYSGVPVQPIPLFPENLGPGKTRRSPCSATRRTSTSGSGGRSDRVDPRPLGGRAEDRGDAPLRREVRRGTRRRQAHQRAALIRGPKDTRS